MARTKAFLALNTIRGMNVLALIAVMAACTAAVVRTKASSTVSAAFTPCPSPTDDQFFVFSALSHILTFALAGLLLISELPFFTGYFLRNWPLLSVEHGLVTLASLMLAIGIKQLGSLDHVDDLGRPIFQLVVASGVINICLGFVNFVAVSISQSMSVPSDEQNYVFSKACITARQMRARAAPDVPISNRTPTSIRTNPQDIEADPVERSVKRHFISVSTNNAHHSYHPSYYPGSPSPVRSQHGRRPVSSVYSRATNWAKVSSPMFRKRQESVVPPVPLKIVPVKMPNVEAVRQPESAYTGQRFF